MSAAEAERSAAAVRRLAAYLASIGMGEAAGALQRLAAEVATVPRDAG